MNDSGSLTVMESIEAREHLVSVVGVGATTLARIGLCPKTHGHASLRDGSPTLYLDAFADHVHTQSASYRFLIPF